MFSDHYLRKKYKSHIALPNFFSLIFGKDIYSKEAPGVRIPQHIPFIFFAPLSEMCHMSNNKRK